MQKKQPTNAMQAQSHAMDWQNWQSQQSLNYSELAGWQDHFKKIAKQFNLTEEFKENGII